MATSNVSNVGEIWKDIQGYEPYHQISNLGKVRSKSTGLIRSASLANNGYYMVGLNGKNKRSFQLVHRLIAIHFIENPENKEQVNHIDGIKTNNSIENLEWSTPRENSQHASKNGLLDSCAQKAKIRMKDIGAMYGKHNIKAAQASRVKRFAKLDNSGNVIAEYENIKKFCRDNGFNEKWFGLCLKSEKPYKGVNYRFITE